MAIPSTHTIYSNNQESKGNRGVMPVVSIIIPSYNGSEYIRKCLLAIRAQSTELSYEVIMADSSNDGTDQIVECRVRKNKG
jgi:GT2 family glycosyltransferase